MQIKKAERINKKMKMGIFGPSGSGKTYSSLLVAKGLAEGDMSKVVIIDTENGSATDYSDLFPGYSVLDLEPPYDPQRYVNAIYACEQAGFQVIIIDSISHVWFGKGGCLEMVDDYRGSVGGKFAAGWKEVTPRYNKFLDAIRYSKAHVICCGRAKQEHAMQEDDKGKKEVVKLGLGVQIREGFEYELTLGLEMGMNHHAIAGSLGKDRTGLFSDSPPKILGEEDGAALLKWCNSGREVTQEEIDAQVVKSLQHQIKTAINQKGLTVPQAQKITGLNTTEGATVDQLQIALEALNQVA
jgi:hypothetical protein